jgi:hypothetical protein
MQAMKTSVSMTRTASVLQRTRVNLFCAAALRRMAFSALFFAGMIKRGVSERVVYVCRNVFKVTAKRANSRRYLSGVDLVIRSHGH